MLLTTQFALMKQLTFICALLLTYATFGQESVTTNLVDVQLNHPTNWKTYINNNLVKIEYKFVECAQNIGYDQEFMMIRVKNKTNQTIQLEWRSDQFYNDVCRTCSYPDEYTYQLSLSPNEVIEPDCSLETERKLRLFSRFTDSNYNGVEENLSDFQLSNLTINQLNQ